MAKICECCRKNLSFFTSGTLCKECKDVLEIRLTSEESATVKKDIRKRIFEEGPNLEREMAKGSYDFVKEMERDDARDKELINRLSKRTDILAVLGEYNKQPQDLLEIKRALILSSSTKVVALEVIKSPKLLKRYLEMVKEGCESEQIAYEMMKSLGG